MKEIMPRIKREWVDQILVVDGGSTDGTLEYARANGYPFIVQKQKGIRYAYIEALEHVQGDVVITFSPDGNSIPELIPPLIAKMNEGYDMVIVSRYLDGAKSHDDDFITAFGNWMFTKAVNVLFAGHYTDAMVMFRAYRRDIISTLRLDDCAAFMVADKLAGTALSWEPLLSARAAKACLRVTEIGGDEPMRIGGDRKMRPFRWGAACCYQFLREKIVRSEGVAERRG